MNAHASLIDCSVVPAADAVAVRLASYRRFACSRLDGKGSPDDVFFVLDYRRDPFAWFALGNYAQVVSESCPQLASDIAEELLRVYDSGVLSSVSVTMEKCLRAHEITISQVLTVLRGLATSGKVNGVT